MTRYVNSSDCEYVRSEGYFKQYKILTSVYVDCKSVVVQVALLYKRGSFLWSGKDKKSLFKAKFCDMPRAISLINSFSTILEGTVFIPGDLERFLFDYEHSGFLECDEKLAKSLVHADYKQDPTLNKMISNDLAYLTNFFETLHKRYWLAGGTLLGWQRDCGIIPHTKDVDFMMKISEYDSRIIENFRGNEIVWLYSTLGQVKFESQLLESFFQPVFKYHSIKNSISNNRNELI